MSAVTVVGNIGEPQLKFTPQGKAVLEFSLAENHSKKNQQGGWDEDGVTWRRVTIWEQKAEALGAILSKGDRVIAVGQERIREWESKDGGKGQSLELNAQHVGIIPRAQQPSQGAQNVASQLGGQAQQGWGAPAQQPAWGAPAADDGSAPF